LQADTSKIIRVLGDFHNLDYWKPESIDYVVMDAAFHHTDYPDIVLKEVARVLRKNGQFVATRETFVPILRPDLVKKHYALAKETRTVENLHRRALIKRMAKENGYRFRHYLLYFPVGFVGKWKQAILEITDGYLTMCNVAFVFEKI
jgi:ubiquinone/menaquinone biosynthesis C-methylase UbiE